MPSAKPKLITILGPTASGKSALAVDLALRFSGEVVSADSRQVYRGLDIGTGKITKKEMRGVAHHLLDIRQPGESYSVAQFQKDAFDAIADILRRKKIPFLVGGTALYIYSVIDNYLFASRKIIQNRQNELNKMPFDQLQSAFDRLNSSNPHPTLSLEGRGINKDDYQNPRRLIRAIEKMETGQSLDSKKGPAKYDNLILGIAVPRSQLYQKIDQRVDVRLKQGMIEEVKNILDKWPQATRSLGEGWLLSLGLEYKLITQFLRRDIASKEELAQKLKFAIHAFARRQLTWWRRDRRIIWIKDKRQAIKKIKKADF